jgi:hypothetical protein
MAWRYEDQGTAGAKFADPSLAFADIHVAHRWATAQLATAEPQSTRAWVLTEERKRLAGLSYEIKRQVRAMGRVD